MLFLLSKCLATPKHLFQKPLWLYDYFRTKTQVSPVSCRFSRKSPKKNTMEHDGSPANGRHRSQSWQADTVRWRTGGPPDSQSHHSRCAAAMAHGPHGPHGSESCCPDENDEAMEDGHFFWVDRPISEQHKGWIGWTLFQDGKELSLMVRGSSKLWFIET